MTAMFIMTAEGATVSTEGSRVVASTPALPAMIDAIREDGYAPGDGTSVDFTGQGWELPFLTLVNTVDQINPAAVPSLMNMWDGGASRSTLPRGVLERGSATRRRRIIFVATREQGVEVARLFGYQVSLDDFEGGYAVAR